MSLPFRIGIADDHSVVRQGLKEIFSTHADLCVVGEAADGRQAMELVRKAQLHALVLDLGMPGLSGADAVASILARSPSTGIVVVSGFPEEQFAIDLFRQGIKSYIGKGACPTLIVEATRAVAAGRRYLTPQVADLLAMQMSNDKPGLPHHTLTRREFQIFLKLADGQTLQNIADALSISSQTVGHIRSQVLKKMNATSASHLTYYAVKHRLKR